MSTSSLDFLRGHQNVYYAGLDDKAFPAKKFCHKTSIEQHLRYLKVLSLLVDHIAIPPTFLMSAMQRPGSNKIITSYFDDFFQTKVIVSAVYDSMSSPKDFIEFKLSEGSAKEKRMLLKHYPQAKKFFTHLPLLQRNVPAQSVGFRSRLIDNVKTAPPLILSDNTKQKLLEQIKITETKGEISLSREMFIEILERIPLEHKTYLFCYYLMNAAYYGQGAKTYFANIACLNAENFSVFGKNMFTADSHGIVIAYDPLLFQHVLLCHGITFHDIDALNIQDIDILRKTTEFLSFKELYFKMCFLLQKTALLGARLSRRRILEFKMELIQAIESRYHLEKKYLANCFYVEDFGNSLILGGLGFFLCGPIGAAIGAALGFVPPILRKSGLSPVAHIAQRLKQGNFYFYLYLELLQEKIGKLVKETDKSSE